MKVENFIGEKVIYDKDGQFLWGVDKDHNLQKLADIRGWGAIQNKFLRTDKPLENAAKFQDELGEWLADAINQKLKNQVTNKQ